MKFLEISEISEISEIPEIPEIGQRQDNKGDLYTFVYICTGYKAEMVYFWHILAYVAYGISAWATMAYEWHMKDKALYQY